MRRTYVPYSHITNERLIKMFENEHKNKLLKHAKQLSPALAWKSKSDVKKWLRKIQ